MEERGELESRSAGGSGPAASAPDDLLHKRRDGAELVGTLPGRHRCLRGAAGKLRLESLGQRRDDLVDVPLGGDIKSALRAGLFPATRHHTRHRVTVFVRALRFYGKRKMIAKTLSRSNLGLLMGF